MRKLYRFFWDCYRQGSIEGLFIAEEGKVEDIIGESVYFGEVLGKHSEIEGTVEARDITIKSDDEAFVAKLAEVLLGSADATGTISGFNPLDYVDEEF
jgi:hypothetical protein